MAGSTIIFFQLVFLTDVAGMNPALAGTVLLRRSHLGCGQRSLDRLAFRPYPNTLGPQIALDAH